MREPSQETRDRDYSKHLAYMQKWAKSNDIEWPFKYTENAIDYFKYLSVRGLRRPAANIAIAALRDYEKRIGRYSSILDFLKIEEVIYDLQFQESEKIKRLSVDAFEKIIVALVQRGDYRSYALIAIMLMMAHTKLRRTAVSEITEADIQKTESGVVIKHNASIWNISYRRDILCLSDALDNLHRTKPFDTQWLFLKKKPRGTEYFDEQKAGRSINNNIKKAIKDFGLERYSSDSISGILL